MSFFGQASPQHAITQFMAHYHAECNHQGFALRIRGANHSGRMRLFVEKRQIDGIGHRPVARGVGVQMIAAVVSGQ